MADKDDKTIVAQVQDGEVFTLPPSGTSETHVNVFKADVEDALKQAHAVINDIELKYQALLAKLGL